MSGKSVYFTNSPRFGTLVYYSIHHIRAAVIRETAHKGDMRFIVEKVSPLGTVEFVYCSDRATATEMARTFVQTEI